MAPDQEKSSMDGSKSSSGTAEAEGTKDGTKTDLLALNLSTVELKELLDEAVNYKIPKDRVGKSKVFLDLLDEVESAEKAEGNVSTGIRGRPLRDQLRVSERGGGGGSLQNICQAVDADSQHHSVKRKSSRVLKGPGSSVSARQREGGSLPCNVNAGWGELLFFCFPRWVPVEVFRLDDSGNKHQIYSSHDTTDGRKMNDDRPLDIASDYSIPLSMSGETCCFQGPPGLDVENNNTGPSVYRSQASFQVADGIGDPCTINGEMPVPLQNSLSVACCMERENRSQDGPRRSVQKQMISVTVSQPNEVRGEESVGSKSSGKKKKHKERNVAQTYNSQDLPGYRYRHRDYDVDTVVNFIENDGKIKATALKKQFPKQKVQDKKLKNLQKASSLEELSQRNIEDLTVSSETDRNESRRCWFEQVLMRCESQKDLTFCTTEQIQSEEDNNDSEFQMVRKKQRRRRNCKTTSIRVRRRGTSQRSPRRKSSSSVPRSERSAESDLDSVHSLPAHPASDSDCDNNGSAHLDPSDASTLTTEDFPSLPAKPEVKADKPKTRSKSVGPNTRPAVILMDGRRSQETNVGELTFGFEVNMQLLSLNDGDSNQLEDSPDKTGHSVWSTSSEKTTELPPKSNASSVPVVTPQTSAPYRKVGAETSLRPKPVVTSKINSMVPVTKTTETPRKPPWKPVDLCVDGVTSAPTSTPVSASSWKSSESLPVKSHSKDLPHLELVRPAGSYVRAQVNPKPPVKPPTDSFGKVVRPTAPVASNVVNNPKDSQSHTSSYLNHYGEKPQKRFNTYIVTNQKKTQEFARSALSGQMPVPAKREKAVNEPSIDKIDWVATCAVEDANGPVPRTVSPKPDDRERRVSDVMTSTDDLETVSATNKANPPLKDCPALLESSEQDSQANNDDSGIVNGDDTIVDDQSFCSSLVSAEHRRLVAFLRSKFEEAINDSETEYYTEG